MMHFNLTPADKHQTFDVTCEARFFNRASIVIKHVGTTEHLRNQFKAEYLAHLHLMLDDYLTFCNAEENALVNNEVSRILQAQKDHLHGCHVALAKDLLHLKEDLEALIPFTQTRDTAKHFLAFVLQTIEQLATQNESLWVRGPIDTLSSGTIYPWIKTPKAA